MSEQRAILDAIEAARHDIREVRSDMKLLAHKSDLERHQKHHQGEIRKVKAMLKFVAVAAVGGWAVLATAMGSTIDGGWQAIGNASKQVGSYVAKVGSHIL